MDTPIRMPFLERRKDNLHITKGAILDGATAFEARSFVKLASGVLAPCVTDDVVCYGWSPDKSHSATDKPPDALFGRYHWPFDPRDSQFIMNITNASGAIGAAGSAPQLSAVTIGTEYELYRDTTTHMQMLDVSATTNKFARVVAIYPGQASTDYNGLVLVELVSTIIQS